jgi:hypothetical protein
VSISSQSLPSLSSKTVLPLTFFETRVKDGVTVSDPCASNRNSF